MKIFKLLLICLVTLIALTIEVTARSKSLRKKHIEIENFEGWGEGKRDPFMARVPGVCAACKSQCTMFRNLYFADRGDVFICECLSNFYISKEGLSDYKAADSKLASEIKNIIPTDKAIHITCPK